MVGIVLGISAVVTAAPTRSVDPTRLGGVMPGLLLVGLIAAAPYALRQRAAAHSLLVVVGAGFAFAASSFSIKLVASSLASGSWVILAPFALIAATAGVAGMLSEQTALQRRQATQVTPIIFVVELIVPLLLAITIGGESWGSNLLSVCSIAAGLGLLTVSVAALTQAPAISGLLGGDRPAKARPTAPLYSVSAPIVAWSR